MHSLSKTTTLSHHLWKHRILLILYPCRDRFRYHHEGIWIKPSTMTSPTILVSTFAPREIHYQVLSGRGRRETFHRKFEISSKSFFRICIQPVEYTLWRWEVKRRSHATGPALWNSLVQILWQGSAAILDIIVGWLSTSTSATWTNQPEQIVCPNCGVASGRCCSLYYSKSQFGQPGEVTQFDPTRTIKGYRSWR